MIRAWARFLSSHLDQPLSHRWEACSKPAVQEGEPDHEPIARIDVLVDMEFEHTELSDP
ncbi:MAG: hypothetical protein AAF526_08835 [Pseudomonadota bacterium]